MRALLDVNVLIAALDMDHDCHERAKDWLTDHAEHGWASCPLTQNGCLRILSQSGYPNPFPIEDVAMRLGEAVRTPHHEFWPDDLSLLDETLVDLSKLQGPKQLTDIYLLALAVRRNGRLVTFDGAIPVSLVRECKAENLVVI